MKYFLTLIVLGVIFQTTKAQLIFKIEELSLSNYNINLDSNIIDEDLENGPYVYFKCLIINNTNDSVVLQPTKSNSTVVFRYNKSDYAFEVAPLPFIDNKKLTIPPKDKIDFSFGSYLLLGTNIFNYKQGNYTEEMLTILPTLRIVYQDEGVKICTDEIKNVILK
jgi:hypothetical protein